MTCNSFSVELTAKWVRGLYTDVYMPGSPTVTPAHTPVLVDGRATIEFAFDEHLEQGTHPVCCTVPGFLEAPSCIDVVIEPDCAEPPRITRVTGGGCSAQANGSLVYCNTQGQQPLTIAGTGFGLAGALVRVAGYACATVAHDGTVPDQSLVAYGCAGEGANHRLRVFPAGTPLRYGEYPNAYTYNVPPIIDRITGCDDYFPSTANCPRSGNATVTVHGANFGDSGASVRFYYQTPPGPAPADRIIATGVAHGMNGTELVASGFAAEGERFAVAVVKAGGEIFTSHQVTLSFLPVAVVPCPFSGGVQCGGNGVCDTSIGVCACFQDATNGFWTGGACAACILGYYGTQCTNECPGGAATPCNGATNGLCHQGVTGTGVCTCNAGYGGTACGTTCPGGIVSPCNGHGNCTQGVDPPTCACDADLANGHWAGATCSACDPMSVGSGCAQKCPTSTGTPTTPCSGQGTCSSAPSGAVCTCNVNYCGADCSITGPGCGFCPDGQFGAGCTQYCPGFDNSSAPTIVTCTGHGNCSEGVAGTGNCVCEPGFAGVACDLMCPTTAGGICGGHGTCDQSTANCSCDVNYAAANCSVECPGLGSAGGVCSGHGTCDWGATGAGECSSCLTGYTGWNCSLPCPGGLSSPCSLHGTCNTNETCTCHSDPVNGFWTGPECASCQPDWYGPNCNGTCPTWNNTQCAGHGSCNVDLTCTCYDSTADGYWQVPVCDV